MECKPAEPPGVVSRSTVIDVITQGERKGKSNDTKNRMASCKFQKKGCKTRVKKGRKNTSQTGHLTNDKLGRSHWGKAKM